MDVLVVVGDSPPPARLEDRARYVHHLEAGESVETLVGALRARIPRMVGVFGPAEEAARVAASLRRAGLPTELFTDEPITGDGLKALVGVDVRPVSDSGPP